MEPRERLRERRRQHVDHAAPTIPDLDLMNWGTGNGGPWNPSRAKATNLYVASIIAVAPKDRESPGIYQRRPTIVRLDAVWEVILRTMQVDGQRARSHADEPERISCMCLTARTAS
jgi:hypothetical protein